MIPLYICRGGPEPLHIAAEIVRSLHACHILPVLHHIQFSSRNSIAPASILTQIFCGLHQPLDIPVSLSLRPAVPGCARGDICQIRLPSLLPQVLCYQHNCTAKNFFLHMLACCCHALHTYAPRNLLLYPSTQLRSPVQMCTYSHPSLRTCMHRQTSALLSMPASAVGIPQAVHAPLSPASLPGRQQQKGRSARWLLTQSSCICGVYTAGRCCLLGRTSPTSWRRQRR